MRLHEKVSLLAFYYNLPDNSVSSTGGTINDDMSSTGGLDSGTLLFSSFGTIMIQKYSITVLDTVLEQKKGIVLSITNYLCLLGHVTLKVEYIYFFLLHHKKLKQDHSLSLLMNLLITSTATSNNY